MAASEYARRFAESARRQKEAADARSTRVVLQVSKDGVNWMNSTPENARLQVAFTNAMARPPVWRFRCRKGDRIGPAIDLSQLRARYPG